MWRLGAMETIFCCPFTLAHRARCAAAILARAAALILRGPCDTRVLFIPLSALIAVSKAFTCCAALSRSAFNCAIMSMCSSPGEDCTRYSKLRGSLHQREQHAQCVVKHPAFLRSESMSFLHSVLMNCLTCDLDTFRKFSEIEFDKSCVVQILPCGIGHSGLPAGVQGSVGEIPGILRLGGSHFSTGAIHVVRFRTDKEKWRSQGHAQDVATFRIITG